MNQPEFEWTVDQRMGNTGRMYTQSWKLKLDGERVGSLARLHDGWWRVYRYRWPAKKERLGEFELWGEAKQVLEQAVLRHAND